MQQFKVNVQVIWVKHMNKALKNYISSTEKKRARGLPSPVASQVVVMTTHGAIGDDKPSNRRSPTFNKKEKWYYDDTSENLSKHNKTSVQRKKIIYISVMHISQ